MIELVPMSETAYGAYLQASIADYAEENVASGRWLEAEALARSRASYESLLPQGLATPDNHIFEIRQSGSVQTVGYLWVAVVVRNGDRSAYIYDVSIHPPYRRRGYAKAAFEALEPVVRGLGLGSIGLHVFAHNPGAQALYEKLGYAVTGLNMQKRLSA
ncbi:MAG TPA: GNAT family N-acetyltransferase [Ideonella sp.]|nr:GNAT family N-acetyltransferase [Ideonella sp.]